MHMKLSKNQSLNKKVCTLAGIIGVSALVVVPAKAQFARADLAKGLTSEASSPSLVTGLSSVSDSADALEAASDETSVDALEAGIPDDTAEVDAVEADAVEVDAVEVEPSVDSMDSIDAQPPANPTEEPEALSDEVPEATSESKDDSLASVAATNESLSAFALALEAAGLTETFSQQGPMTVFAPSNEAFEALPTGMLDQLLNDPETLRRILAFHVVSGDVSSDQLESGAIPTAEGSTIDVEAENDEIKVNGASVVEADLEAENGVVHIIDEVILPPNL